MKIPLLPQLMPARAAALAVVLLAAPCLRAQTTYYWDNNGATAGFGTAGGTWAAPTTNNSTQGWSTSSAGTSSLSGTTTTTTSDALNFGTASAGLAAGTITVSGTVSANSLTFGSQSGAIVLSGGTISLGGTTPTITVNNAADTISSAITGSAGLTKNGTGTLTLSNTNTYSGGTTINAGTINATNSSALGSGNVSVAAGGKLVVVANNLTIANNITLNGTTTNGAIYSNQTVAGVTTNLTGQITLNATSNVSTWWNDKTLQLSGKITGVGGLDFVLQPGSVGGRYLIMGATNDYAGATSVTGSATAQYNYTGQAMLYLGATNALPTTTALTLNNADLYLNGQAQTLTSISGSGNFSVQNGSTNAATLTLGSGNTTSNFSGTIKNNGISVSNTSSSPATVTGTVALTKIGTGTLTLSGNNTYTGTTTVSAGTLEIGAAGRLGAGSYAGSISNNGTLIYSGTNAQTLSGVISGTGALTQNAASTLTLSGNSTYTGATTISAGTLKLGSATGISSASTLNATGGVFDLNGFNATVAAVGVGNAAGTITNSASGSGTNTLTITNYTVNLASLITDGATAKTAVTIYNNGGANALSNANNTFSGGLTIANGGSNARLYQGSVTNTLVNGTLTKSSLGTGTVYIGANGSTAAAQLMLSSGSVYNNIVVNGAPTYADGGRAAFRIDGTVALYGTLTAGASDISLSNGSGTGSATAYGQITGTNGLLLNPSQGTAFTLTLANTANAANNYSGNTTISDKTTLVLGAANQIANGAGKGNLIINSGNFSMGGFSETINGLTGNGTIDGNGATLTVGDNDATSTFSGVIKNTAGTLALTKIGNGTLSLSGTNTYSGSTTINAGTLAVSGNISSSALTINSGGVISAGTTAAITKFNAASLTVAGNSGYAFTIGNISGGTAGTAGTDYDQIATSGAITFNNTAANPFTVYINGTPTNWSSSGSYTWNILSGSSLSGFSSGNFVADYSSFGGALASGASWTFGASGGNLTLTYGTAGTPTWAGGSGVWSGNFTPSISSNLDMLFTGAGGTATNDIASGTLSSVGTITFNSTAGSYTLAANSGSAGNGSTLNVAGSIVNNSANAQTINNALALTSVRTINTASGNITLGGAISGAGGISKNGSSTLTLSGNNTYAGNTTISAGTLQIGGAGLLGGGNYSNTISNSGTLLYTSTANQILSGVISGAGALTKNGASTLTLSGNNTYTGATALNAGMIQIGHASGLGVGGNITFGGGGLQYGSGITADVSSRLKNSASAILIDTNSNNVTFASAVDSTNSGGLTKNGTGTLTLSGNNTYTGATTISAGTLEVGSAGRLGAGNYTQNIVNNGTFIYSGTSNQTLSGIISGSGALTKNAASTLTLSGNNTYTGSTTLNAGTLRVGNNSAFGASSVVVNSSSVIIDSAVSTSYTLSNNITLNTRGTIGATAAMGNLTLGGIISGTGDLKVDTTAGVTTLTGLNTFTGNLIVDRAGEGLSFNSIANAGVASAVGAGSSISLGAGGVSTPIFTYTGNAAASSNRSISLTGSAAYIISRNASLTLSGNITSTSQSLYLQGNAGGGANFNELSGIYSGGGSLYVQVGSGDVWKISGNNTYTGITYSQFSSATIAGHSNAFGSTANGTQVTQNSQILLTGNISVGAEALTLNSGAFGSWNGQTGAALRSYTGNNSWAGAITLGQATNIATNSGAGLTLSGGIGGTFNLFFNSIGDTIASGNITIGTGNLNKSGAGNLTLSGNNTYTGTTTISAGTLQIGGAGLLGGGSYSAIISNSGALVYSSTANQTLSGNITGAGSLTKNNTGTLTLLGTANTYNGATAVSGGTLQLAGNITSSALTLNSGGVISVGTNSTVTTVGKANAASLTLNAGSGFALTIGNVNASVAGTDYDQITASGALTLNNTAASPFTVYLNGTPTGWNNGSIYSWDIISAASLSGVFNSGNFTTNFDSFGIAAENRTGTWSFLNPSGGTIRLTYTALAGNSTWNTGTGDWNTGSNWTENTAPNNNNNLVFTGAGGTATNNIGNGTLTTVTDITFASGAGAYTLNASAGSAGASGGTPLALIGTIANNSSNLQTINTDLAINIGSTINAASGNITIGGAISGSAGITKTGNNALTLSGANTYNGTTALNSGTLNINSATALGNGTFTITGGTIDNTSGAAITLTKNNTQNWNGDFTFTGTRDLNLGTGNVTMGASRTITVNAGNLTVLGNIAGAGFGLTKNGSGTLTINSSSTFTGAKTVNAGTLRLVAPGGNAFGSNNTVNINNGSTLQIGWVGANNPAFQGNTVNFDTNGGGTLLNDNLNGLIQFGGFFTINTNGGAQNQLTSANGGLYNEQGANGGLILNVASGSNATADLLLAVAGSYAITKNGTGKVLVTASPTLRGITINNGVLEFGGSSTPTFSASLAFTNNGTFSYNSTASSTISQNITGTGNLTKSNTSTLTLNGTNSYTGLTTITAGTLAIGNNMTIGAIAGTGGNLSLGAGFTLTTNASTNTTLSSVVQGSGNLAKSGTGTLTLNGSNTYTGGTTLNAGTLVIGNTAAAGTGTITQTNGTSLLKLDTTGTITNAMSVYNVLATQSATLSGAITVNNATWDVDAGDTLTVSGAVAGNGGVTKIGNGTLILSGSNSYNGSTVINAGTLNAANANALGSNNTVQVNGGTLLVSADDAINGMNITLNGTSTNLAGLAFNGTYSGSVDNLTLSKNSIIDLGEGSVSIMFDTFVMSTYMLDIYNWTGTTLWNGGTGNDTDKVYFGPDLSDAALAKIRFHSGAVGVGDSFLGSGFDLGLKATGFTPAWGHQIIPVPEPETWATGLLLLLGGAVWLWRKRSSLTTQRNLEGDAPSAP